MSVTETNNGLKGGILQGNSHKKGGIDAIVVSDNNRPVELEGEEAIVNKKTMKSNKLHQFDGEKKTPKEIISDLNVEGGGVEIFEDGGEIKDCPNCEDKKKAFYKIKTKYARKLANLHSNKTFEISNLQENDLLLIFCNATNNYKLQEIVKIANDNITAINLATKEKTTFDFKNLLQNETTLYSHKKILKKGGKIKNTTTTRFSKVKIIPRNEIITDARIFQGREGEYSQKTVDKIVNEGYDKSENPIVVWFDAKTQKYIVISGHSRWEASKILYTKGDKSLAEMPVKIFNGTKTEAVEYAVIESNRGGDPESLISDIKAFKLAINHGWNKEKLLGFFSPESRIEKLRDLSYLNDKGMFLEYLGKDGEASFPYLERNARWVGNIRRLYSDKITNTHENEIFNFFWKPKKGKPNYNINKQRFFHLIDKKISILDYDKTKTLNLENVKISKTATQIDKQIEDVSKTIDWLMAEFSHKTEIKLQAKKNNNTQLQEKSELEIKNIIISLENKISKRMIFEKQLIEVEKMPVVDLFSQQETPQQSKQTITNADLINILKKK